jgi:hypothetical protein
MFLSYTSPYAFISYLNDMCEKIDLKTQTFAPTLALITVLILYFTCFNRAASDIPIIINKTSPKYETIVIS